MRLNGGGSRSRAFSTGVPRAQNTTDDREVHAIPFATKIKRYASTTGSSPGNLQLG